ncbi:Gfo/Idh/MocA family protein [Humibacter sp.]|uniref:Gfo/Idh/MocA family protein n=1 Tax=Humibacter sp. TaxID=1940291 RepID=UPI003F81F4DC
MTGRVKVALIGAGSMGRNHARIISESDAADLVTIIDPVREAAEPVAEATGATWSPELDAVAGADAVVVAASTEHHFSIASNVIAMGKPLLIEKPICPSLEQTLEITDAAARAGLPLMCGFLERYNPAIMVAHRMVTDPVYVRADRHSPYVPRIKTGVAWDLLVHDVDLIAQLFGGASPDTVRMETGRFHPSSVPGAEDVIEVSLGFSSGALGSASASRLSQRKVRTMVIQTLDRMVEIDLLRRGVTAYRHTVIESDEVGGAGFRQATEMEVPEITGREPLATQFARFVSLLRGEIDADAERESYLPAHRIVERALRARPEAA